MIIDIIPCVVVTSLEPDAFMAIVASFDMLMVTRKPSERSKRRRYARISCYSAKKTSKVVCISRLRSIEFYSTES